MYGSHQNQSSSQAPGYNYDSLFGTTDHTAYNAQYHQYLAALTQYQQSAGNAASLAAGYGSSLLDSYGGGAFSTNSTIPGPPPSESTAQFTSFEQAMMQQSRMLSQSANRPSAGFGNIKPSSFGKRTFIGKGIGQGGGFQKRKGPPKPPVDLNKYFCQTCSVSCANPQAYQDHIAGKAHKRKEDITKGNPQPLAKNKSSFQCVVCNVTCTGKESFETHMNGIKHAKAIKNLKLLGKTIPENISTVIPPANPLPNTVDPNTSLGELSGFDISEENMQPVGEEFIEVLEGPGKTTQYRCKLCECTCGDGTAKSLHVRGRRHRMTYKQKVDHSIYVDTKSNIRNIKMKRLTREKEPKIPNFPVNWTLSQLETMSINSNPDTGMYDSYEEQHICAKLEQLRANPKIIEEVDSLIGMVEKALKRTSELLTEKGSTTVKNEDGDSFDNRVLCGVIRTGVLGDRLLTKSDRQICAALLCKTIPTVSLLQAITAQFIDNIEDEGLRQKTILDTCIEDAGFSIKFKDGEVTCFITMTSITLVEPESGEADQRPRDVLPVDPMLASLSHMRQTKFFQTQCWPIQGLCETVVLLRDMFSRTPAWNFLPLHAIELLVYKTIITSPVMPRICDAFRRFFEMMASGQFMSQNTKLFDPCERGEIDIFSNIGRQQRENMMCSAQTAVRLIAFDQIHSLLGIDRLPVLNRKRPNNEDDDENGIKKEKKDSL